MNKRKETVELFRNMKTKRTIDETIELFRNNAEDYFKEAHRATATADQAAFYAIAETYENAAFELENNLASPEEELAIKLVSERFDIPEDRLDPEDPMVIFYAKVIIAGDAKGIVIDSRYQADDFAYLNTLFGYDIGFEAAYALATYACEDFDCDNVMDVACAIMAETRSLEKLKNYFQSLGDLHGLRHLNLSFCHFADELPESILFSDWSESLSIQRFKQSLEKWLKDPYDMVDAMFGYDVDYRNVNAIKKHTDDIIEDILSVYKADSESAIIKDPERVENVREKYRKINDEENLDLHFDRFFKRFPNCIN